MHDPHDDHMSTPHHHDLELPHDREVRVGPAASNAPGKFRYETDADGRVRQVHNGMNRKQRRVAQAQQKKYFKVLIKDLQKKAAQLKKVASAVQANQPADTASFEEVAAATHVPQAPESVPDEG